MYFIVVAFFTLACMFIESLFSLSFDKEASVIV